MEFISENGVLHLKFNQNLVFESSFIEKINKDEKNIFTIKYLSGWSTTSTNERPSMTNWSVVSAEGNQIKVQLDFINPQSVSKGPIPCTLEVSFGDG